MRILVTGAGGQLGREMTMTTGRGADVTGVQRPQCDITEAASVSRALREHRPDVVINCAAWTQVDAAEERRDDAWRVNAIGPRVLATLCHRAGVRLVHISTDFVFDGSARTAIDEWQPTSPVNAYGASKLAGEHEVRALCPDHVIVRTAWLYGQDGPNFVLTMIRLARESGALRVVGDQHGAPTWTGHVAPAILRLLELGVDGTFHITNSGSTTWHGFAQAIVQTYGLGVPVTAITTADYPTPARRPSFSALDNRAWRLLGEASLPDWRDGLDAYAAIRPLPGAP